MYKDENSKLIFYMRYLCVSNNLKVNFRTDGTITLKWIVGIVYAVHWVFKIHTGFGRQFFTS